MLLRSEKSLSGGVTNGGHKIACLHKHSAAIAALTALMGTNRLMPTGASKAERGMYH